MNRYHRALEGFDSARIDLFSNALTGKRFVFSKHFYSQVAFRLSEAEQRQLATLLYNIILHGADCFEYYTEAEQIVKACYRLPFNAKDDIILVVSNTKSVITAYTNAVGDNHATLQGERYGRATI